MTRYRAIFATGDQFHDAEVGSEYGLAATTCEVAASKALELPQPEEAKLIKVLDEGRVVRRIWFPL